MISVKKQLKAVASTMLLLSSFAGVQTAFAVGTAANTTVSNTATVNYNVLGTPQTPISSAPATFVVDNRIDLEVTEVSGANTDVAPGQTNAVLEFRVTNEGNAPEGFQLSASNLANGTALFGNADNTDFAPLNVFVDNPGAGGTLGVYDVGFDTAANINTLNADANVIVFVVINVPLTATNGQFANVSLQARAAVPGSNGTVLETETAGADTAGVDIVFGDAAPRDATQTADDQYAVQSAALLITKGSTVISDPFNGVSPNAKAIPGAVVEYVVTIANTGLVAAGGVRLADTLDTNLAFVQGQYAGATDVQIQVGAAPATFCVAEAGADANGDGCNRAGATLNVNPTVAISVPPGQSAVVRFRVSIN